ncbi:MULTISPECIES: CobW family GTP-binding protein [Agrobacterium tumefaciens complex]|uniref:GTP-binding protein n=1 Tax=Agrobacterium tumefaciens TaxID=358 RepID=A0AAP4YR73_AGRTU|nr:MULTISPECIES: GTP-binding protein [Agrobacterium tumefaciens complex]MBB4407128.1 G3E family GTPase [Agrobacterium radiobacter]MBB4452668.1 G3E family GTPase [Agrobacterium radiobacter]MDP9856054.1 G3E family GTPase [Agrobacterium tumefaciens]MDP9873079.1 G3E family GTPase [Agrobacterium tumefaciens]MDP9978304.1 G3E family GTPase [Agrobacterium tumefaciens]
MSRDRIPVSIITGFLGAGKSTLLNRLLKDPAMSDAAIIINEFGDVSIDHMLVESAGEGIIELAEGCLCCTVRGELVDTLAELMDGIQTGKLKPVKRVVIETTGLADPAPVMQSVMGNPVIAQNFVLNGMITVVDAVNGLSTLDNHQEAVKQAAVADRLVMTKRALADAATISALTARLQILNPRATIEDGDKTDWSAAELLDNGLYDAGSKNADVGRWLGEEAADDHHHHDHDHDHDHHHHHDDHDDHHHHHDVNRHDASIRSFSIIHDQPVSPMAIDMFVDLLRSAHGEKLLRMKAIVKLSDNPGRPLVLHGVQNIFHTPERLAAWPDPADQRTRMVLITKDLPEAFVKDLFAAFTSAPGIDRPDRQAMTDNPLAVSGLRF